MLFFNLGGGPSWVGDTFGFTEGGLVHAVCSFSPLVPQYDVTVICPNVPPDFQGREFMFDGVRIVCPAAPRLVRWMRVGELSFSDRGWRAILNWPTILAEYLAARRELGTCRPDVVLANGIVGSYLLSTIPHRCPVVAVIHHLYHDPRTSGPGSRPSGLMARAERLLLRRLTVDGVAVVNPAVASRLLECGFDPNRVAFVGNGVNANRYSFADKGDSKVVVFVGRLRRAKCIDGLLDAFSLVHERCPDAVLHLAGDGPLRRSLEQRAASLGLGERVVFHGFLSEEKKVLLLQSAAVYLSASLFEGFGIPLVEAMATGAVPVVSDISAHRFIFQDRRVGYLVATPEEMASRTLLLLEDANLRDGMAREGRMLVEEKWTWDAVADRYRRLLDGLLAASSRIPEDSGASGLS